MWWSARLPFLKPFTGANQDQEIPQSSALLPMPLSCSLGMREGKTLRRVKKVASGEWAQDLLAAWVMMAVAFRTQTGLSNPAQRTPRDAKQPSSRTIIWME
jgi:hypothetical protein